MLATVFIGSCVAVQGLFVKRLANGLVMVRVGDRVYSGRPASAIGAA